MRERETRTHTYTHTHIHAHTDRERLILKRIYRHAKGDNVMAHAGIVQASLLWVQDPRSLKYNGM